MRKQNQKKNRVSKATIAFLLALSFIMMPMEGVVYADGETQSEEISSAAITNDEAFSEEDRPDATGIFDSNEYTGGEELDDQYTGLMIGRDNEIHPEDVLPAESPVGMRIMELNPLNGGAAIIALDAGHDVRHAGANHNGLAEEQLTWQVRDACATALQATGNVRIIKTGGISGTAACPYPNSDAQFCLYQAMYDAKAQGANYFISFHFNATGTGTAEGAMVLVPSNGGNATIGYWGQRLGTEITAELAKVGLYNRGNVYKLWDNPGSAQHYSDGAVYDYYANVRETKLMGITGIIIEHAFLDNAHDAALLKQSGALTTIGQADAKGIIRALSIPSAVVSATDNSGGQQKTYGLSVTNAEGLGTASQVRFAVWSETGGQDDLYWYEGTKSGSTWSATADITNRHKTAGKYQVHVYSTIGGQSIFVGSTTFNTSMNGATALTVTQNNANLVVTLTGASAPSGVAKVQIPAWSNSGGQDDLVWYTATKASDGVYTVTIPLSNHNYTPGVYSLHAYVTAGNGIYSAVKSTSYNVTLPTASIVPPVDRGQQKSYALAAANVDVFGVASQVRFAVWSEIGGQDDLVWYSGTKSGATWNAVADITNNHKTEGLYQVHIYATVGGKSVFVGNTTFTVSSNTASSLSFAQSGLNIKVTLSGVVAPSGVTKVQIPTWSNSDGQDDLVWYNASKEAEGVYSVTIPLSNHNYTPGLYASHAYITSGNGIVSFVKSASFSPVLPTASIFPPIDRGQQKSYALSATSVDIFGIASQVRFAVWSETGGQDDLVWYNGTKSGTTWNAVADIANNHKTAGKYLVHVYATVGGKSVYIGATSVTVSANTASSLSFAQSGLNVKVTLSGVVAPSGVTKVQIPAWSQKGGQNDLIWYTASKESEGVYSATIPLINHDYTPGIYTFHAYVTSGNGIVSFVKGMDHSVSIPPPTVEATVAANEMTTALIVKNPEYAGSIKSLRFAVWSEAGGQDDLYWYTGTKTGATWAGTVDIANRHQTAGLYNVHVYAVIDGVEQFICAKTFVISEPRGTLTPVVYNGNYTFSASLTNIQSKSGVKKVEFPTWSAPNHADIKWYEGSAVSRDSSSVVINPQNHNNNTGTYNIHAYITANNNIKVAVSSGTFPVTSAQIDTSGLYSIMGTSNVTVAQMVSWYNSKGQSYPAAALGGTGASGKNGGAPNITEFAKIVLEEANAEGVKAEVVFAQVMKETGWLQFGGDVKINQFNFAGLGATGGVPGNTFDTVRIGIRAQVQHLKAYASTLPLNQAQVDTRFGYVTRGIAPYVLWLGIQENPNHVGWASGAGYGASLTSMIWELRGM